MNGDREPARRVVYITYDGLEDQLGQSQVIPYLKALAARGHSIHVVSFEKAPVKLRVSERLADRLCWTALRYHKAPSVPATAFDMAHGLAVAAALSFSGGRADLVHVRSTLPGAIALPLVRASGIPLFFDTRALWADQRAETGAWSSAGYVYRGAKAVERALYRRAAAITVLTRSMHRYLRVEYPYRSEIRAPIHVIPTCADLERFSPATQPDAELKAALGDAHTLVYVGSLGGLYLGEAMARFYVEYRRFSQSARFLVISRNDPKEIQQVLRREGLERELVYRAASHERMPALIRCAHAAVAFVAPLLANRGTSPTKLAETLGCGLPTAATSVGDVSDVLEGSRAGVVVDETSQPALATAARALHEASLIPGIATEARYLAQRWFRLDDAVERYAAVYASMCGSSHAVPDMPWPSR